MRMIDSYRRPPAGPERASCAADLVKPSREVILDVLIHEKRDPCCWHYSDHAWNQTSVESSDALLSPGPRNHAPKAFPIFLFGLVVLQPASQDLVWVSHGAGNEFRPAGEQNSGFCCHWSPLVTLPRAASEIPPLRRFVNGKLHGTVRDPEEGYTQAAIESADALRLE